jgi:hypothetical protein
LEEEQWTIVALEDEAHAAALKIEPPPPTKMETGGPSLSSAAANYEDIVVTNVHAQATGMHDIRSLVSVALDPASTHYAS